MWEGSVDTVDSATPGEVALGGIREEAGSWKIS